MVKLIIGFVILAGAVLYLMSKGGDIDMGGEKHGIETHEAPAVPKIDAVGKKIP
jgi:hypothetical protein